MKPTTTVTGGNQLAAKVLDLQRRLEKNSRTLVGLPKAAGTYEDGTPIAVIGAVQEFGSADGHIPERSFLRVPLRSNQELFIRIMKNLLPKVAAGEITMRNMLEMIGQRAVAVSQEAISAGIAPANAASTVAQKGSSVPLVDTGFLRQNITYVIEEGDS